MPSKEEAVELQSGRRSLAALLHLPKSPRGAAVLCHPHPQYGGDKEHPIVEATAAALAAADFATLRFDFRGAADSRAFSGLAGGVEDVRAAIELLQSHTKQTPLALVGYSFGAMAATLAAAAVDSVDALVAIALPVPMFDPKPVQSLGVPKLFVHPEHDDYCPRPAIDELAVVLPGRAEVVSIAGADHFLNGYGTPVAGETCRFLESLTAGA